MLPTLIRRSIFARSPAAVSVPASAAHEIPYYLRNRFRAKKLWPPDFGTLTPKEQFRLERKYRRRSKLKYTSEKWIRWVTIFQMWMILGESRMSRVGGMMLIQDIGVTGYAVLFFDWNMKNEPFGAVCLFREKVSLLIVTIGPQMVLGTL